MLRPASRRDNDRTTNDSYRATNGIWTRSGWSAFDHRTEWFHQSLKALDVRRSSRGTGSESKRRETSSQCSAKRFGPTVEGIVEMEFSPAIVIVSDEQDGLADNRHDCVLVVLRQAVHESRRNALEQDHLPRFGFTVVGAQISPSSCGPLPSRTNRLIDSREFRLTESLA